jgi:hypothetical protein
VRIYPDTNPHYQHPTALIFYELIEDFSGEPELEPRFVPIPRETVEPALKRARDLVESLGLPDTQALGQYRYMIQFEMNAIHVDWVAARNASLVGVAGTMVATMVVSLAATTGGSFRFAF